MLAIYRRELKSFFYTPAAYVFIGVFLMLGSVFFIIGNLAGRSSNLLLLLSNMSYLWMLLSPILTMKLLTINQTGTDRLLYSSPISLTAIVTGKFFAACTVMLCAVVLSFVYPILVAIYGHLYMAETLTGYVGFILQGCAFIALDMLVSCFCQSPVTASIASFGMNLLLWLGGIFAEALETKVVSDVFAFIDLYNRVEPFLQGRLNFASLIYDLSFISIMLFLCVRVLDARRWSDAK